MAYQHNGNAAELLLDSYKRDSNPFVTDTTIRFPDRDGGFEEIKKLKELFFRNYWNSGLIIINELELKKKINELGQLFFDGIKPFFSEDAKMSEFPIQSMTGGVNSLTTTGKILSTKNHPSMTGGSLVSAIIDNVLEQLANIREKLKKDVEAAYKGDPAARSYAEIIRAYPGFGAIGIQRVAHILYQLGVPSYPRELTEYIHSKTGIDIHPGAKIGEYFFIDHGTGVVIGETAEIGDWVRIYQGVTLGVLHFEQEGEGVLKKGYKRHPVIGSHVVVGAGAKLLGPIIIGSHVNIGANSWITEDIPVYTSVFVAEHPRLEKRNKKGR